jgi:hypothetical protein
MIRCASINGYDDFISLAEDKRPSESRLTFEHGVTSWSPFYKFELLATRRTQQMSWRTYVYGHIAAEISRLTKYYDSVVQHEPLPHDDGLLLSLVECKSCTTSYADASYNAAPALGGSTRCIILLNGNLNYSHDVQVLLASVRCRLGRTGRLIAVVYNSYLRWIYMLASRFGIRKGDEPTTSITMNDLRHLARLSGFELVSIRNCVSVLWRLFGVGTLANRVLPFVPLLRWLAFACVATFRPLFSPGTTKDPSLSIIVPARNKEGNIDDCLLRLPDLPGVSVEVIFCSNATTRIMRQPLAY